MTSFLLAIFGVLRIVEENLDRIWNPEDIVSKKHVIFM